MEACRTPVQCFIYTLQAAGQQPMAEFIRQDISCHKQRTDTNFNLGSVQHGEIIDNIQHCACHLQHALHWASKAGFCSIFIMPCIRNPACSVTPSASHAGVPDQQHDQAARSEYRLTSNGHVCVTCSKRIRVSNHVKSGSIADAS